MLIAHRGLSLCSCSSVSYTGNIQSGNGNVLTRSERSLYESAGIACSNFKIRPRQGVISLELPNIRHHETSGVPLSCNFVICHANTCVPTLGTVM
jgi:hypothetical protein